MVQCISYGLCFYIKLQELTPHLPVPKKLKPADSPHPANSPHAPLFLVSIWQWCILKLTLDRLYSQNEVLCSDFGFDFTMISIKTDIGLISIINCYFWFQFHNDVYQNWHWTNYIVKVKCNVAIHYQSSPKYDRINWYRSLYYHGALLVCRSYIDFFYIKLE